MKNYRIYPSGNSDFPWAIDEGAISTAYLVKGFNLEGCACYSQDRMTNPPQWSSFIDQPGIGPDSWISIIAEAQFAAGFVGFTAIAKEQKNG